MRIWLGLAAAACALGAAHAADLNDPVWDQAPGQAAWAKAYPAHAASAGIAGSVKMKCAATSSGQLSNCAVIQEAPIGEGFGAAALSLATQMALKPADGAGRPVAGRNLIVPVRFEPALLHHPGTIIGQPDWLRKPTQEELSEYFPADAKGVAGQTQIDCVVSDRGLLEKCEVASESPTGHGFGSSAILMSSIFLMRPMTLDGLPVGGARVFIPIKFEAGPAQLEPDQRRIRLLKMAPWMTAPTADQVAAAFPKAAIGKTASAHIVLRCDFRNNGDLSNCDAVSETPEGQGFAVAAKSLAHDFRAYVNPKTDKLADMKVDVPFDFRDPSHVGPPLEIYDPLWIRRLNPAAVVKIFPPEAVKAGVTSGVGNVDCTVSHDGTLTDCTIAAEAPAGLGFGAAALEVASIMQMNPWTAQGDPVDGGRIRLPVRLELPKDTPAVSPTAAGGH